eukprot:scaffold2739_cov257-Pinguiococcus_pyrenoidosus.AAC.21
MEARGGRPQRRPRSSGIHRRPSRDSDASTIVARSFPVLHDSHRTVSRLRAVYRARTVSQKPHDDVLLGALAAHVKVYGLHVP